MNTAEFIEGISGNGPIVFHQTISPGKENIQWELCGDIADTAGRFFCSKTDLVSCEEARGTISYVLNEILENAVKFNCGGEVNISCVLSGPYLTISVSNTLEREAAVSFKETITELKSDDPFSLLMKRIEANALDPDSSGSGIGLLTLMGDYGADLKWLFSDVDDKNTTNVNTIATISF